MQHKTKENLTVHCTTCFVAYAAMTKDKSVARQEASSKKQLIQGVFIPPLEVVLELNSSGSFMNTL